MRDLTRDALFFAIACVLATLSAMAYTASKARWASDNCFSVVSFLNSLTTFLSAFLRALF